jgi:nitrate reductase NapD
MTEHHVSSLVVHGHPDRIPSIVDGLASIEGVEIHGGGNSGKLIVTLETGTEDEIVERTNAIRLLDGVLAATLVFHHVEQVSERE